MLFFLFSWLRLFFFFFPSPSAHTNPSRFYKPLTFASFKYSSLTSQSICIFPSTLINFVHMSITRPLPCTGLPRLLIYILVGMSGFVSTDYKLQESRNLVFLVFVYWHILISTWWKGWRKDRLKWILGLELHHSLFHWFGIFLLKTHYMSDTPLVAEDTTK